MVNWISARVVALCALLAAVALAHEPIMHRVAAQVPDKQAASGSFALVGPPPPLPITAIDKGVAKSSVLTSSLDELSRLNVVSNALGRPMTAQTRLTPELEAMKASRRLRVDSTNAVQVFVTTAGAPTQLLDPLVALGFVAERTDADARILQGSLPVGSLQAAAQLPGVTSVREPDYARFSAGSVTTQGDSLLHADQLRAQLGSDGTGVRVGVISDGLYGLATSQSTGDAPLSIDKTTCNVNGGDPTVAAAGSEGTAMIEIIHDIAPGAQIWFAYSGTGTATGGTALDFNAAVNCLAAHVDVVVDDVGFINVGPYDGTGYVSANTASALNNPANPIRGYYTAVGNSALMHYKETYAATGNTITGTGTDSWVLHGFQSTPRTTDSGYGLPCPTPSAPVYCGNPVVVAPGGTFAIALSWNDPWGASTNDYDLLLLDGYDGAFYLASANRQSGAGSNPSEIFAFQNNHPVTTGFYVLIGNYKGLAAPRSLNMFLDCIGCQPVANSRFFNFETLGESVANNGDAGGGVISVGVLQPYSSQGPTEDGRLKPEVTGVDGVSVSGAGGFLSPFYGTSAASPHAAGIAALLLGCNPALRASSSNDPVQSRKTLYDALIKSAAVIQGPSPNNAAGYGQLDAWAATAPARCTPAINTVAGTNSSGFSGDGGDALNAKLSDPWDAAVDSQGTVYIADRLNCRVRQVARGIIRTVAGTGTCGYDGDNKPATQAQLSYPASVLVDGSGSLLIADVGDCRIRKVADGVITTIAGTGTCAYNGASGPATSVALYGPTGLALDTAGNIFFADAGNCRIRELSGGTVTTVAGVGTGVGVGCGSGGDGGPATNAQLNGPGGVAVDSTGNIYIADTFNCRVREVSGGTIATVLGGSPCASGGVSDSGPALGAVLYYLSDVAIDRFGRVIVADTGFRRVLEFHGGAFTLLAGAWGVAYGSGDGGLPTRAGLNGPMGIGLDQFGNLYIADTSDYRVRVVNEVDKDNDGLPEWVETGTGTYVSALNTGSSANKADSDADACGDGAEIKFAPALDPNNPWDFYSVPTPALLLGQPSTRDKGIGITTDVVALLAYSGMHTGSLAYDQDRDANGIADGRQYDRSQVVTNGHSFAGPPDGGIGVTTDVVTMLAWSGKIC